VVSDERSFNVAVGFDVVISSSGRFFLNVNVSQRHFGMGYQIVPERQMSDQMRISGPEGVDMVGALVTTFAEIPASRYAESSFGFVTPFDEPVCMVVQRILIGHLQQNIDDRFCGEAGNRGAADMMDLNS